jgi:hypothetical protein
MKTLLLSLCLLTTACVSFPRDPYLTSAAAYVGDRSALSFGEIVVTVRGPAGSGPYHNLHIGLGALFNLKSVSLFDLYDARDIVFRAQPRVSARVVEAVLAANEVDPAQLAALRERVADAAQREVDTAFAKWGGSKQWEVQLVVTSLYLTDPSVGRMVSRGSPWLIN